MRFWRRRRNWRRRGDEGAPTFPIHGPHRSADNGCRTSRAFASLTSPSYPDLAIRRIADLETPIPWRGGTRPTSGRFFSCRRSPRLRDASTGVRIPVGTPDFQRPVSRMSYGPLRFLRFADWQQLTQVLAEALAQEDLRRVHQKDREYPRKTFRASELLSVLMVFPRWAP